MPRGRFVAVVLVVGILAAACAGDDADGGSAGARDACPVKALDGVTTPVDITLWHAMTERNERTLQSLVDAYNTSQSKVRVKAVFQGSYNQTLDKYIAALRGGDLPDIVQMEETAMQLMVDSKSTVPAAVCIAADNYDVSDFNPRLFGQYSVAGQLVTMPFQLSNPVLYYNKAAFRRAGLDPDKPPVTLDDVLGASRAIVASGATPKAFSLQLQGWYPEQWVSMAGEPLVDNDNGRAARATAAKLDGDAFGAVFRWIETMNTEGLVKNVGRDDRLTDALIAVAVEEVAMTVGTSAALGTIYDQLALFPKVELGVAPLPGPQASGVTVGGGSLYLMSNSSDQQKAAAWDFVKYLSTPESQAAWHIGTGYIPTRVSATSRADVQALWSQRPGFKVAYDQLARAKTPPGGGGPVIGDYVGFRNAVEAGTEAILNGTDAATAQAQAQAAATRAIQDYNKRIGA